MKRKLVLITLAFVIGFSIICMGAANMKKKEHTIILGDHNFRVEIVSNTSELALEYGPRFDNTAYVNGVWIGSKSFLKSGNGLVDEFGISGIGVLNFEKAQVGEAFLKIGVGAIIRDTNESYMFWHKYPVDEEWPVECNQINAYEVKVSQISKEVGGYAYEYYKRYRIDPNTQMLLIIYTLKNCGKEPFEFEQYNHNWFNFSQQPIGPDYHIVSDFKIAPDFNVAEWVHSKAQKLTIAVPITKPCHYSIPVKALKQNNHLTVSNKVCGQSVHISGDFNVSRFDLFTQPDAVCPEVFMQNKIGPNESYTWRRTYIFTAK